MAKKVKKIHEMAILIDIDCGGWDGRITDEKATKTAIEQHKAKDKAGVFRKNLIDRDALSALSKYIPKARDIVKKYTIEWVPKKKGAERLLPTSLFDACTSELRALINEQEETKNSFCERWEERLEEAEAYLGDMFNRNEYPTADVIRKKFYIKVDFKKVPPTGSLIVDLNEEALAEVQDNIDAQEIEREQAMVRDIGVRLYKSLTTITDRLTSDRKPSERSANATVRDLNEIANLLPALNITNDPDLAQFASEIKAKLAKLDPAQIKEDSTFRDDKAKEVKAILDRMGAYAQLASSDEED